MKHRVAREKRKLKRTDETLHRLHEASEERKDRNQDKKRELRYDRHKDNQLMDRIEGKIDKLHDKMDAVVDTKHRLKAASHERKERNQAKKRELYYDTGKDDAIRRHLKADLKVAKSRKKADPVQAAKKRLMKKKMGHH